MRSAQQWLEEYELTHQNPLNQKIHMIAVPLIFWSILAFLATQPPLTLMLLLPALSFYFALGMRFGLAMVLVTAVCLMISFGMIFLGLPLKWISVGVFGLAWAAQFYGHRVEGKRPAFFKDLLYLLIGPLWTLKKARILN